MASLGDLSMGQGSSISGGQASTGPFTGGASSFDSSGWNVAFGSGGITSSANKDGNSNTVLYVGLGVMVLVALVTLKRAR
ncbi:hypothetical protein P3G55_20725 [Leptospira sp. 96542]|nr:hypothetical protein [Leptospira sp. 96542]